MGRAVIYTRVSSLAQEDGYSLEVQERDGREWCKANGRDVVAVESDTFSGHDTMDERDGLQAAIRRIRRGEADTLVIWRIDRANRFMLDNQLLFRDVCEAGGTFASVKDGIIPNTPVGKFILSAHSFVGETEWESIRDRTQAGLTARIGKGHILVAPVPLYGYKFVGDRKETYEPDPESAPVLQDMYAKSDAGWSCHRIAGWLQAQGIPTPSMLLFKRGELPGTRKVAQEWTTQMVLDTLRNESYTGKHAARRHVTYKETVTLDDGRVVAKMRRRVRPESDEKYQALTIPALVSEEQWARVQEQLKGRHTERDESDMPLLSRGIAVCGVCGSRMVSVRSKLWKERRYMCMNRSKGCAGSGFAIKAPVVDDDVWAKAKEIVRDDERFTRLVEGKSARLAERHREAIERAERTERELTDAREMQATVYARMMGEKNDTIYAMHHVELERLAASVVGLEKRATAERAAIAEAVGKRDSHAALLAKIDALIAETQAELGGHPNSAVAAVRGAWERPEQVKERLGRATQVRDRLEEVTLDSFDREARRGVLRLLNASVVMYPVNAEYSQNNPTRWDFRFGRTVDLSQGRS